MVTAIASIQATGTTIAQDNPSDPGSPLVYISGDIDGGATDGATAATFHVPGPHVPLTSSPKQIDVAIRLAIAAEILNSLGWTIAPKDILLNGQYLRG